MAKNILVEEEKCEILERIAEIYKALTDENRKTFAMFGECMVTAQNITKAVQ